MNRTEILGTKASMIKKALVIFVVTIMILLIKSTTVSGIWITTANSMGLNTGAVRTISATFGIDRGVSPTITWTSSNTAVARVEAQAPSGRGGR